MDLGYKYKVEQGTGRREGKEQPTLLGEIREDCPEEVPFEV